jgi:hypothetical protein
MSTTSVLPEVERIEVSLVHTDRGAQLRYMEYQRSVIEKYKLLEKLRAADDGQDTHIMGVLKGGNYYATSVLEGTAGKLSALSALDFVLFCDSLSIPYIEPPL